MINGVNHITLSIGDVERAFRFFVETLGAKPLARWSRGAYLLAGDVWLCLTRDEHTRSSPLPEYSHIAFGVAVAKFDDTAARTTGAKVPRFIFSILTVTSSKSTPGIGGPASPR